MKFKPLTTIDELKAAQAAGLRIQALTGEGWRADTEIAENWINHPYCLFRAEVLDEPGGVLAMGREDLYNTANDAFNDVYDGAPDGGGVRSALRHVVDCVLAELPAQRYPDEAVKALLEAATDLLKVCDALLQADLVPPMAHTRTALANLEPKS